MLESLFNKVRGLGSLLHKVAGLRPATLLKRDAETLLKKTPVQVFSCEYCEVFKNIFLTEHPRTTASKGLGINTSRDVARTPAKI